MAAAGLGLWLLSYLTACNERHDEPSATLPSNSAEPDSTTRGQTTIASRHSVPVSAKRDAAVPGSWPSAESSTAPTGSATATLEQAEKLMSAGQAKQARELLFAGERKYSNDPRFRVAIEKAIDADPRFAPPTRTIDIDRGVTAIKYLGGGSTITLRFLNDDEIVGAFKPRQTRRQSDFRSEIAAWRLAVLLRCAFVIPYNEPARLKYENFFRLYGRIKTPHQRAYEKNLVDLAPLTDRHGQRWIYGTLKAWVRDFVPFPIEKTQLWRSWLRIEGDSLSLRQLALPAADSFRSLSSRFGGLTAHLAKTSKRQLARQLSQLIAFDFLITNWDRFSRLSEFYGSNCQFKRGRIVAIDNGASFGVSPSERVDQPLRMVQRFSRQQIQAIRQLDAKRTLARLFPHASDYDRQRFALFSQQRRKLLRYVDELVSRFGRRRVLCFE